MNVDKQKLKALAKTSTHFTEVGKGDRVEVWDRKKGHRRATYTDMDYLAATNPNVVLELLAEIERLEADNNAMRGSTKRMGEDASKMQKQMRTAQRDIRRAERRLHEVAALCATVEKERDKLKTENEALRSGVVVKNLTCAEVREAFNQAYYQPREIGSDGEQCRAGVLAVFSVAMAKEHGQ